MSPPLAWSAIGVARAKHVRLSSLKLETLASIADREATRPLALTKGGAREARRRRSQGRLALRARSGADHEAVVGVFRDLPPQNLVVAECLHRIQDLFVVGVRRRSLGIDLVRRLQARFHDRLRERTQLRAGRNETLQGGRVARIVPGR